MPFKSPNFVSNLDSFFRLAYELYPRARLVFLLFFILNLGAQTFAEERYFGYRGRVPGVEGQNIKSMSIRSDGRYLFYTTGVANFQVLDLLDMSRKWRNVPESERTSTDSSPTSDVVGTNAVAFGTYLMSDTRLAVATAAGVQYFNVTSPFDVKEESQRFVRDVNSDTKVIDTCFDSSQQIYFLERASNDSRSHLIRKVKDLNQIENFSFSSSPSSFPTDATPLYIRCRGASVFIVASRTVNGRDQLWVGTTGSAAVNILDLIPSEYSRKDFTLNEKGDSLLFLFNKDSVATSEIQSTDSKVLVVPLSGPTTIVDIGSSAKALASFTDAAQAFLGFFVGYDPLLFRSDPTVADSLNKFLFTSAGLSSGANDTYGKRGVGLPSNAPTTIGTSTWVSSKSDHYKYGAIDSLGITLISNAPSLQFVQNPMGQSLTAAQSLSFSLVSDSELTYEIRLDEDAPDAGSSTGIATNVGNLIKSGTLVANQNTAFSISVSDLKITKNRIHSLMIFGRAPSDGPSGLTARTGFTFEYDPPPGNVLNFRLGFGDQSALTRFDLPGDGDIKTVLIHFSYDPADLTTLPTTADELAAMVRTVSTGVHDGVLTSPLQLTVAEFGRGYVIAPIQNGKTIYVRPQLVDNKSQYSTNNVDALSVTPYRTLTLPEALGNSASCALNGTIGWPSKAAYPASIVFGLFLYLWIYLRFLVRGKKLGPALLRNRRGGD